MSKYVRHQPIITRSTDDQIDDDHWLKQFAKSLEKDAVQSRQVDQTLFHQINNIMNTKSKYTSVAAAVEDMKERSGLTAYLNKINKTSETTEVVKPKTSSNKNASNEFYQRGHDDGQEDLKNHGFGSSVIASLNSQKNKVPHEHWMDYAKGYFKGSNMSEKIQQHEMHNLKEYLSKKQDSNNAVNKKVDMTPIVIKKFPGIKNTLENHIKDSKGNLSIPAIIDKIRSIHQKDVSDAKDWEDDKLMLLVSKLNLDAKKNNPNSYENFSDLGRRERTNDDIDPSNTDAFHSLNPVKS